MNKKFMKVMALSMAVMTSAAVFASCGKDGSGATELAGARHLSHGLGRTERLAHIGLNAHDELALQGLNQRINGHFDLNLSQNGLLRQYTSEGSLGRCVYFSDARRCSAAPMSGASPSREPMRIGVP